MGFPISSANVDRGSKDTNERKLAHLEKIAWINPIEGADNIESVGVLGWVLIAKKEEFKVGDWTVFFEIDSKLPEAEWSEFMRSKDFKVKTYKLGKFGIIGQGLALPINVFPKALWMDNLIEGMDLTKELNITYSVAEDNIRKSKTVDPTAKYNSMAIRHQKLFKTKPIRWLMKRLWGKKVLFFFLGKKKDKPLVFPTHFEFVSKTDETRCENIPWVLENKDEWIVTQKIDGTSSTYILERKKLSLWDKITGKLPFEYYVLSRNVRQMNRDQSNWHNNNGEMSDNVYWEMSDKYHIFDFLKDMLDHNPNWDYVCLQGETAGESLQGNPLKFKGRQFFGFNFIDSKKGRWSSTIAKALCEQYKIPWCPIINEHYILPDTMEELKLQADGKSVVGSGLREGFVYRSQDGKSSFKNVSRKYLLKHNE